MPRQQSVTLTGAGELFKSPAACLDKTQQQRLNLTPTRMRVESIWQARMGWLSWK